MPKKKINHILTLAKSSRIYTGQYTFPIWLLSDDNMLGAHKRGEKSIAYGRLFFRKSTFCTLTEAKPGFDGHWVMPEIFLLNGTFTMLESTMYRVSHNGTI